MKKMADVYILFSLILFSVYVTEQAYFLEENYINKINEQATTWKVISNKIYYLNCVRIYYYVYVYSLYVLRYILFEQVSHIILYD